MFEAQQHLVRCDACRSNKAKRNRNIEAINLIGETGSSINIQASDPTDKHKAFIYRQVLVHNSSTEQNNLHQQFMSLDMADGGEGEQENTLDRLTFFVPLQVASL